MLAKLAKLASTEFGAVVGVGEDGSLGVVCVLVDGGEVGEVG